MGAQSILSSLQTVAARALPTNLTVSFAFHQGAAAKKTTPKRRWSFGRKSHDRLALNEEASKGESGASPQDQNKVVSTATEEVDTSGNEVSKSVTSFGEPVFREYGPAEVAASIKIQTAFRGYLVQHSLDRTLC